MDARAAEFTDIADWLENIQKDTSVYWLRGDKAAGKSVVTHCFARVCRKHHTLAATYSLDAKNATPQALVSTLAANVITDVANYMQQPFQHYLSQRVKTLLKTMSPEEFFAQKIGMQIELALVPAWERLDELEKKPLLFLIDGIDKLNRANGLPLLIEFIRTAIEKLPVAFFLSGCQGTDNSPDLVLRKLKDSGLDAYMRTWDIKKYQPDAAARDIDSSDDEEVQEVDVVIPSTADDVDDVTPKAPAFNLKRSDTVRPSTRRRQRSDTLTRGVQITNEDLDARAPQLPAGAPIVLAGGLGRLNIASSSMSDCLEINTSRFCVTRAQLGIRTGALARAPLRPTGRQASAAS